MRLQAKNIGRYADMRLDRIGIYILAALIAWGTKGIHKDPLLLNLIGFLKHVFGLE